MRRWLRRSIADVWPLWLTAALGLYVFRAWYFSTGYLTFGDFRIVRPATVHSMFPFITLWIPQYGMGVGSPLWAQFFSYFGWMSHLGIDFGLAERPVFFWLFPAALALGTYFLASDVSRSRVGGAVAALYSLFNGWLLTVALGGEPNFTNATSMAPWVLLGALRFMRTGRLAWLSVIAVAAAIEGAHDLRWLPPTFIFVAALVIAYGIKHRSRTVFIQALCVGGAFVFGVIAENLYWLIPRVFAHGAVPAPPSGNLAEHWAVSGSVNSFRDALASWNPYFLNGWRRAPILFQHAPIVAVAIPIMACAGAFLSKRRSALFFAFMYVAGAAITAGANPPLGRLYVWMFVHVPIMGAYRDPGIFGFIPLLSSAVLIAYFVAWAQTRAKPFSQVTAVIAVAAVIAPVWHAFDPHLGGVAVVRPLPAEYRDLDAVMAADGRFGRILFLPQTPRWYATTPQHPALDGLVAGTNEFRPWCRKSGDDVDALSYVQSPLFRWILRTASIKYIAVPLDIETDATIDGGSETLTRISAALRNQPWIGTPRRIGNVLLYTLPEYNPLVWTTSSASVAEGDGSVLLSAAPFPNIVNGRAIVLSGDAGKGARFDASIRNMAQQEPSAPTNQGYARTDRVIAASAVTLGMRYGDALLTSENVAAAGSTAERFIGPATVSITGSWQPSVIATLRAFASARSAIPASYRSDTLETYGAASQLITRNGAVDAAIEPIRRVPLWRRPVVTLKVPRAAAPGSLFAVFLARDPATRITYAFTAEVQGTNESFDGHDVAWQSLAAASGKLPRIAAHDGYDRLTLYAAGLIRMRTNGAFEDRLFGMNVHVDGQILNVARATHIPVTQFQIAPHIAIPGAVNGWSTLRLAPWEFTTIDVPTGPLDVRSSAALFLGFASKTPGTSIALVYQVVSPRNEQGYLLYPDGAIMTWNAAQAALVLRDDLWGYGGSAKVVLSDVLANLPEGYRLNGVRIVVRNASQFPQHASIQMSDALLAVGTARYQAAPFSGSLQTLPAATHANMTPAYAMTSGKTVLAVDDHTGILPRAAIAGAIDEGNGTTVHVTARGGRWLVFSQDYDPQWVLTNASGRPAGIHQRAFGFENAWYEPGGFSGEYTLTYRPNVFVPVGEVLGLALILAAIAAALFDLRAQRRVVLVRGEEGVSSVAP